MGGVSRRGFLCDGASAMVAGAMGGRGLLGELLAPQSAAVAGGAAAAERRAAWMQEGRYRWGVMTHYLSDWQGRANKLAMSPAVWNGMVKGFDVEGMAQRLAAAGVGHYQISIGQNSGYYLSPNAVYDRLTKAETSKCSERDLVAELYGPLSKRGIKLMVYLPSGAPAGDKAARTALEWEDGAHANREFQEKWQQVIAEWSKRWGDKVAGWWFDGCYYPNTMYRSAEGPNFASFAAAARAGNGRACVAFNPGVVYRFLSLTPEEDFTAGEIDKPEMAAVKRAEKGWVDGTLVHMLSYLGEQWGGGAPRFSAEQVVGFTGKILNAGGAVTWDVPVEMDGTIREEFLVQLAAVGKAFPRG